MFTYENGKLSVSIGSSAIRATYAAIVLLLGAMTVSCVAYISISYHILAKWYLSLNNCFYNSATWQINFFTPAVKQAGNLFAGIGTILSLAGIYLAIRQWKKAGNTHYLVKHTISNAVWYTAVTILGILAALWEWKLMAPAYDEIFSAVNCAELHPFQTWSYYMLPNNHVLFNLANNLLFGWHGHLVGTGRLISVAAYVGTLLIAFQWLANAMKQKSLAFVALIPVAFQFVVWGMSAQARGYECQLICGWIAFTSLLKVNEKENAITLNAIANIVGFALVPSWFYFFTAQLMYIISRTIITRNVSRQYWIYQVAVIATTFLFYLPTLCFSGTAAMSGNKYVKASTESLAVFVPNLLLLGRNFMSYCFSHIVSEHSILSFILFAVPLCLFFFKPYRHLAGFYIATWGAYLLCSLYIRHTPFHRTLIVQFSLTMALTVFAFWAVTNYAFGKLRHPVLATISKTTLFAIPVLLIGGYFIQYNKKNINFGLYSNDVNGLYGMHLNTIGSIPAGSSISFSEESFYFYYHCRKLGYRVIRCGKGAEQFFVKRTDEQLPPLYHTNYILLQQGGEDYEIYKRK